MHKNILWAPLLALLTGCAAMAYEQPKYAVAGSSPSFELRRYAPYAVVETTVRGEFDAARNAAFRRLFAYISGANRDQQKLDMTIPVVTESARQKIEMTAPVLTASADSGAMLMQFVLASRFSAHTAPVPTDPAVRVREVGEQWIAARTFSGRASESNFRDNEAALLDAMREAGVTPLGEPRFAVYNGPFTPWFLRRNEVLVPVAKRHTDVAPPAAALVEERE